MTPIEQSVESLVDSILLDYRQGRAIDQLESFDQPDKELIIDMIGKLLRIMYPATPGTNATASTTPGTTSACSSRMCCII